MRVKYCILILLTVFTISCKTDSKNKMVKDEPTLIAIDSLLQDVSLLQDSFNEDNSTINEHLVEKLKPIQENFKRINLITDWSFIDKEELWETTEGGEARYYYQNEQLEKIVTHQFGETFQVITEYYLLNGQLSFAYRKLYIYNRPIYYDSTMMKENNDNEMFDFEKSEIVEDRLYFANRKLIHQVYKQSSESPLLSYDKPYWREEIITDFEKFIELAKK